MSHYVEGVIAGKAIGRSIYFELADQTYPWFDIRRIQLSRYGARTLLPIVLKLKRLGRRQITYQPFQIGVFVNLYSKLRRSHYHRHQSELIARSRRGTVPQQPVLSLVCLSHFGAVLPPARPGHPSSGLGIRKALREKNRQTDRSHSAQVHGDHATLFYSPNRMNTRPFGLTVRTKYILAKPGE
jgi:hypothetical protein